MYQVPQADINLQVIEVLDEKRVKVKVINTNQSLDGHIFECSIDNLEKVHLYHLFLICFQCNIYFQLILQVVVDERHDKINQF